MRLAPQPRGLSRPIEFGCASSAFDLQRNQADHAATHAFSLDTKDPKFWDGGLSVIAGVIDELEAIG